MWTTKELVVGQEVFIFDRAHSRDIGRVTKISPSGDVEINVCTTRAPNAIAKIRTAFIPERILLLFVG
jgi:hypothetical protein